MMFQGQTWRKSRTVVTLPELESGVNVQFGKICEKDTPGAILTEWTREQDGEEPEPIYATPIKSIGWGRTNKMYGENFVRDGEVRQKAYLAFNGRVYTTSWVHKTKTETYQLKKAEKGHK